MQKIEYITLAIFLWIILILALLGYMDIYHSTFFRFGPSEHLLFFSTPINTWIRYLLLCLYVIINQTLMTIALNVISPWLINTIQNITITVISLQKWKIYLISIIWTMYLWLEGLVAIRVYLSQIDILLYVFLVNQFASTLILTRYLKEKSYYEPSPLDITF